MGPIVQWRAVEGGIGRLRCSALDRQNIHYQQNLKDRRIAIVVLGNSRRPLVHRYIDRVIAAVNAATPGSYTEVDIPLPPKEPFTRS